MGTVFPFVAASAAARDTTLIVENGRVIVGDGWVLESGSVVMDVVIRRGEVVVQD